MKDAISQSKNKSGRHFVLIGGFLGAGKTTLIEKLTEFLEGSNYQVALITNDQGEGLMDTASARRATRGADNIAEITGGCFCCRLDELVDSIKVLDASTRPDVMIAEPVGSCTDLMATVLQPLEKIYQTPLILAPLAVVLDARRALASLGGKSSRRSFHRDVGYIYFKQLEEAKWLIVNKCDLLEIEELKNLEMLLESKHPDKKIYKISAKTGEGLENFFGDLLASESAPDEIMEVDYERYAEGEAMLGWVNLEGSLTLNGHPGEWLLALGKRISGMLDANECEVGHFKMSLDSAGQRWRVHQVMGQDEMELITEGFATPGRKPELHLLINLRAEGDAKILQQFVHIALHEQSQAEVTLSNEAAFQPGKPVPTHRIA